MPRLVPLLAAVALATTAACDDGHRKAPPPSPPAERDAAAAPAYQHRPGPAYLGVTGVGLLRLEGGTLTRILSHGYPFQGIVVDAAGVVYATAIGGLWRIDGTRISRLDDDAGLSLAALALGPDGVLWTSDRREVGRWDGTWTREPAETFGALIQDLAVDLDGRVWVVTHQAMWRLDGDHWSQLDPGFTGNDGTPFFRAVTVDVSGAVHVSFMGGSAVLRDGTWIDSGMGDLARSIDDLVAGPDGHVAGSAGLDTVVVRSPAGALRRTELTESGAAVRRGDLRAVDGAGRLWISTDNGLLVLDEHGDVAQHWSPGTVAGVSGAVTAVAVVADGPSLPAQRPAVSGALTGRVRRGGKPVAGAEVQVCDLPMYSFQRTPCELSTFSRLATTAADGAFRLDGVPPGSYGFAIKPDRTWRVILELDIERECCAALEDGGVHDVGVITVR